MRGLTAVLLGAWLGASILADMAVTQNFQAVDRFLAAPGNAGTSAELNAIGRERERVILRRNAGEENNWIFLNWERAELVIGAGLLLLFLLGERQRRSVLTLSVVLLAVVAAEHFFLTSRITDLGRIVDDLPATDPRYKTFWTLHGVYSGLDILKIVAQFGLAALLMRRSNGLAGVGQEIRLGQELKHG
ncbi:MAG TPA: hypothetical protein VHY84_19930 [Bryobacteraceae bacterium]|jgi:hypothetical protein|nr:hypothetical protein [Bryobacteraceae bacterium]